MLADRCLGAVGWGVWSQGRPRTVWGLAGEMGVEDGVWVAKRMGIVGGGTRAGGDMACRMCRVIGGNQWQSVP